MNDLKSQKVYYVVFVKTKYASMQEVVSKAAEEVATHIANSKKLHEQGKLLMAGAFLDKPDEPVSTMGILISRQDAEAYINDDPFVAKGMVSDWYIREWANIFA